MKKMFEKKLLALFFIISAVFAFPCGMYAQVAFENYSPTAAPSITVCDGSSEDLTIDFRMAVTTSNPIQVRVTLADGIEYAGGLVLNQVNPVGAIAIAEADVSNPNEPVFKITSNDGDNDIQLDTQISFSFKRRAGCKAWSNAISANTTGFVFKDIVTIVVDGASTSKESNTYYVSFPNLILNAPDAQNNKQPGDPITREFTISSGSANAVRTVYIAIDHGIEDYFSGDGAYKLAVVGAGGSAVEVSSPHVVGTKRIYTLTGGLLGSDNLLTDGEIITLRETFKLKTCNLKTFYGLGWGCSIDSQCEVKEAEAVITMMAGAAKVSYLPLTVPNLTSPCEPFSITASYKNEGTGDKMGGMYDVNVIGRCSQYNPQEFKMHQFLEFKVGGKTVSNSYGNDRAVDIRLEDVFDSDPDGVDEGLDDLDGDGFYDDLPVGATLKLEIVIKFRCNDFTNCNSFQGDYGYVSKVKYHTACDKVNWVDPPQYHIYPLTHMTFHQADISNLSYLPINIEAGKFFEMKIETRWISFRNSYITNNSRYVIEIDLVPGLEIDPNKITWAPMLKPTFENDFTYGAPISPGAVTQSGGKLIIVSPNSRFGRVFIKDMVYNCQPGGNDLRIKYRTRLILDYINHPTCLCPVAPLMCGEHIPRLIGCDPDCPNGLSTGVPVVEREDNSLGWTDYKMTALQSRSNISAYDLAKALYMDEIRLSSTAVQHGSAHNLGARLVLNTDTKKKNGLQPLSADIVISRNGSPLVSANALTVFKDATSSDKQEQIIDWDFTSVLPAGGLQEGDKVSIVARYRVISEDFPREDKQAGKKWYVYNSSSAPGSSVWDGVHTFCLDVIPEMYLMGTRALNGVNPIRSKACEKTDLGGTSSNFARRFDAGALNYENEYRPGIKLLNYYVKMPKSYTLNLIKYRNDHNPPGYLLEPLMPQTVTDQGGDFLYKYSIPNNDRSHFPITVANRYGANIIINATPSCASNDITPQYETFDAYTEFIDYYYYTAKLATIPNEFKKGGIGQTASELLGQKSILQYSDKPSIELLDQTGEVELAGKTGSWTVRYNNPSQAASPFIWLALPDVSGLKITRVTRLSDNQEIPASPYSGGKMFHLSDAGVPAGKAIDCKIEFEYSGCAPITLAAMGGWNCSGYPASPSEYICNINTLQLKLRPLVSAMELIQVSVPPAVPEPILCTTLPYEYRIQATDKANIYNPMFTIVAEDGLTVTPNIVQVRYPAETGVWQDLNVVNNVVNLLDHPALQTIGYLKGAEEAVAGNRERQIDIKFGIKTGCEFVSGKNFRVKADGKNTCNMNAKGSGIAVSTPPIRIQGAVMPYTTSASTQVVTVDVTGSDCKAPKIVKVNQVIIGGITTADAYLEVIIPLGFKYVPGSYAPDNDLPGGANAYAAGTESVSTTANSEDKITVKIKGGLGSGSSFAYKFEIEEDNQNVPPCGNHKLEITNIEKIPGLWCEGVQCLATYVATGVNKFEFALDKPYLDVTVGSAVSVPSGGNENITIEYTVKNTSNIPLKQGTVVTLLSDQDNNLVYSAGEVIVGTQPLSASVTNTSPVTQTLKVKGVNPANTSNLVLSILPQDGCYCEIDPAKVVLVKLPSNYWIGGTVGKPNEWKEPNNWTNNSVPAAAEDVEFATEVNNPTDPNNPKSGPAKENLHLDDLSQNGTAGRVIGNLINDSDKDLVITQGNQLTINGVVEDNNPNAGTIVVKSSKDNPTGTLLFANPGNNQNVGGTVEFYNQGYDCANCGMYRRSWQYFGIPVNESDFPVNDVLGNETVNQWVEPFNGDKWRPAPFAPDTKLQKFKGYQITNDMQAQPQAQPTGVYSFTGTLCVCDAFLNLTRTPDVNYSGANLVGNSYTAAIDIKQGIVFPPEVEQTVYLFNTGTRDQWRKLNGSTVPGYRAGQYLSVPKNTAGQDNLPDRIPSMHSFLLKMQHGASCTLQILYDKLLKNTTVNNGNGDQIAWRSGKSGSANMPSLVMDVLGNESADRLWIFTESGLTFGFDNGWDGRKLAEKGLSRLYAMSDIGNDKFQVAAVPELNNLLIGFDADKDGQYTLEFALSEHFSKGAVFLHDLQTEAKHRITNSTSYSFVAKRGDSGARFRLSFDETWDDSEDTSVLVGTVGKRIVVTNNSAQDYTAHVYTADGKLLFRQEVKSGGKSMTEPLIDGAYVVSLQSPVTGSDVRKVIVD